MIAVAVLAVLLVVAAAVVVVSLTSDSANASQVALEPVDTEVDDPFTDSVGRGAETAWASASDDDAGSAGAAAAGAAQVDGTSPGLYGGTRDDATCDQEQLVEFLDSADQKATAWAAVQGIERTDIGDYVEDLTPVVLTRDTLVTNHGYADGAATARQAVLQRGTAVMVDDQGVPRVKCSCGNPLVEPDALTDSTEYVGTRWAGFDPGAVTIVEAGRDLDAFVLIDADSGDPFTRPVGTDGSDDRAADEGDVDEVEPDEPPSTDDGGSDAPEGELLYEINSVLAVSNEPTLPTVITLDAPSVVTEIRTYHWNDGSGATPGTIGLHGLYDDVDYGPWPATGEEGQGDVPNAYWVASPGVELPAGAYDVVDSDPSTWSWADDTGGAGIVQVYGYATGPVTEDTEAPDTGPGPTSGSSGGREDEAAGWVLDAIDYCSPDASLYITDVSAEFIEYELYYVVVTIELDSGGWSAGYDVDFATEDFPQITPWDADSAALACL